MKNFRTDFGGTPMLVSVGGKKYPVRFTARPDATPAQKRPGTPMGTQGPTKRLKKGDRSCEVCGKSHSKFSDVEKGLLLNSNIHVKVASYPPTHLTLEK